MTRIIQANQMQIGEVDISQINIEARSRDDIPKILRGLQYLYMQSKLRDKIFTLLEESLSKVVNLNRGRSGMSLWKILVMGVLRLDLNCDYDRLHNLVNEHCLIREMLGHSVFDRDSQYGLQTIKDNVGLLTPEILEAINIEIVNAGHALVKKKDQRLRGRCDSFVVETNVHYPTDVNLLADAMRKVIQLSAQLSDHHHISGWRQFAYHVGQIKGQLKKISQRKRIHGRTEQQKQQARSAMVAAHEQLINLSEPLLEKAKETLKAVEQSARMDSASLVMIGEIQGFIAHAERQIDQTRRRVCWGETIPHDEKVFSLFEPHTEWIVKGKAGVPCELGVRVGIVEDQHQFILHHRVMRHETDVDVAVPMIRQTKANFSNLHSCSFDKGFFSPSNMTLLSEELAVVAMRSKGKPSIKQRQWEGADEFKQAHYKHAAVESAINALEVHGLDVCRDKGIHGFKRYVALAVLTRNIHRIGDILHKKEQKRLARSDKRCRDGTQLAA